MLNLKLALLATTAVGAVTAGGIAYATVGSDTPSAPAKVKAITGAAGDAARGATSKVPAVPTCLPAAAEGKLAKAKNHVMKNHHIVNGVPKVGVPNVPGAGVPNVPGAPGVPNVPGVPSTLPKAPVGVPSAVPSGLPKVPGNLPTCLPSVPKAGANPVQGVTPDKPGLPQLPEGKLPSCDTVPPAISERKAQAKDLGLPTGMHLAYAHAHSITVQSRQVCENVEKFVGTAGSFITVERIQTPPQVTLQELAAALQMPQTKALSVSGLQGLQTPLGTGMVWLSDQGYAIALNGSPSVASQLPLMATQLQRLK